MAKYNPVNITPENNIIEVNPNYNIINVNPVTGVVEVSYPGIIGPQGPSGSSQPFVSGSGNTFTTTSSLEITGSVLSTGGFTGSLKGTASWANNALTASFFSGSISNAAFATSASYASSSTSASYALTASFALNAGTQINTGSFVTTSSFNVFTSSYNTGSFTGSFTGSLLGTSSWSISSSQAISSSFALTASFSLNAGTTVNTSSFVTTSSFNSYTQSINSFTSSYNTGSFTGSFTGSLSGTASWAQNAISASWAPTNTTGSFTGSFTGSVQGTSSWAISSSQALTASFYGGSVTSASYASSSTSASFAITSSLPLRGITTASAANTTITFTRGDGTTFDVTVSQSGSVATASYALFAETASLAPNYTLLTDFNNYTGSARSGSFTGSFIGSLLGTASWAVNSSQSISSSYALNGGVTQLLAGPNVVLSPTNGLGQVTISATLSGSTGFNTATGSYGSFYDTTTQTNPVANIPRSMSFNETDITNGVSISGSTSPFNTYIKTENPGVYNIQFSAQVEKTDSGTDVITIWLRKNGIDLTDSATKLTLTGNGTKVVAAWNWFVSSAANDYYQIIWVSADTGMRLYAEPINDTPGIPSVILTVNRIDQFLSNTGSFTGSFTGSVLGTSSWSISSSTAITSSFAETASLAPNYTLLTTFNNYTGSARTGSFTGSFTGSLLGTSSWALSSSQSISSSFATSASFAPTNTTGSFTGSFTGSLLGTSSWAVSSSQATSASFALTASFALNAGTQINTSSFVTTSSFNSFTQSINSFTSSYNTGSFTGSFTGSLLGTASYATNALTASFALNAPGSSTTGSFTGSFTGSVLGTSSYATNALSSSYAVTASYALNATSGGGDVTVLDSNNAQTGPINTTTETAVYSYTLPTDFVAGEVLELNIVGQYRNQNTAKTVTCRIKLGGTTILSMAPSVGASASIRGWLGRLLVFIETPASVQRMSYFGLSNTAAVGSIGTGIGLTNTPWNGNGYGEATIDLTTAKTLELTIEFSAADANSFVYAESAQLIRYAAP